MTFDPTRMSVHLVFANEDAMRVPGLEDAFVRDMRMALRDRMDFVIFNGDDGANENTADIAGIFGLAGITERTISQANKVKGDKTLEEFTALTDGLHAEDLSDLRVVALVGSTRLWLNTIHNSAAENQTIAEFRLQLGLKRRTRQGIETSTAADDYGAAIGRNRGITGAGVRPISSGR